MYPCSRYILVTSKKPPKSWKGCKTTQQKQHSDQKKGLVIYLKALTYLSIDLCMQLKKYVKKDWPKLAFSTKSTISKETYDHGRYTWCFLRYVLAISKSCNQGRLTTLVDCFLSFHLSVIFIPPPHPSHLYSLSCSYNGCNLTLHRTQLIMDDWSFYDPSRTAPHTQVAHSE